MFLCARRTKFPWLDHRQGVTGYGMLSLWQTVPHDSFPQLHVVQVRIRIET